MTPRLRDGGPIAWMARNPVAANLLMLVMIVGGLFMAAEVKQEFLPATEPDSISVTIGLPGATPEEVEQSIILTVEEQLRSIQGVEKLTSIASEGSASFIAALSGERDTQTVYNDFQTAVDRVTNLPEDADEPDVQLDIRRREVVELHLYGDVDDRSLRMAAEQVRGFLLQQPEISQVDLEGVRALEIQIEPSAAALLAHDLTLGEIADTIRRAALDRAGGTLETRQGDLLLRLADRRYTALEFANIPVITDRGGTVLRLGDIATVRQGFEDSNDRASFDGKPAIRIEVFRVGNETPISVADTVRRVLPDAMVTLPAALDIVILNDRSQYYRDRMNLLLKNGLIGLLLVLAVLTLFLEIRLAFWVAVGIPVAFLGTLFVLPWTDQSINLVSMFAFIVALGIVVDDAIVAGENIYEYRQRGMGRVDAAIQGARDIAVPLSFSILTNIVAFIPLALLPGWMGKLWFVIPLVVSLAFIMSWIEALFVLPAHLAGVREAEKNPGLLKRLQLWLAGSLDWFVARVYGPVLRTALHWRYTTAAAMVAVLLVTIAWVDSGRMGWGLFPSVPRDNSRAIVTMPVGTPLEETEKVRDRVVAVAQKIIAQNGGDQLGVGVYAYISDTKIQIRAYLQPPGVRPMGTREFTQLWREAVGKVPEARSIRYESAWGGPGGSSLEIRLTHADADVLATAAADLAGQLTEFGQIRDPDDGFTPGKAQIEFRLTEEGHAAGLTSEAVAAQVRDAFYGIEALAQQEGRNEVSVRVRLPAGERASEADIENLLIRTPDGGWVPLFEIAHVARGRSDAKITREDGFRIVSVTANVEPASETNQIIAAATADTLPRLMEDYPGLSYSFEGRQAAQRDTMDELHDVLDPAGADHHLRAAWRSPSGPICSPLVDHDGDPVRIRGRRDRASRSWAIRAVDYLGLRDHRARWRGHQRGHRDDRLREQGARQRHDPVRGNLARRAAPVPPDPAYDAYHLRRARPDDLGDVTPGTVPDPDGDLARLRHCLRHPDRAVPDPGALPDARGCPSHRPLAPVPCAARAGAGAGTHPRPPAGRSRVGSKDEAHPDPGRSPHHAERRGPANLDRLLGRRARHALYLRAAQSGRPLGQPSLLRSGATDG